MTDQPVTQFANDLAVDLGYESARKVRSAVTWKHFAKGLRNSFGTALNRAGLEFENFTVISNDCWGQALYEGYGLPYQTPLVGAGMHADCFLCFLTDIEGYLRSPLRFIAKSRYMAVKRLRNHSHLWPIGLLRDDVEVHFMHYYTEDACRRMWDAGCEKLRLDRLAVKFTADKDGATPEHVKRFAAMHFERKLLISRRNYPEISCAIQTPNFVLNGAVMFRRSIKYFDCTHWLNTGQIRRNTPRVWTSKILYARGV
jgi:uncharacterized protein (DUF1919 family)